MLSVGHPIPIISRGLLLSIESVSIIFVNFDLDGKRTL